MKKLIPYLIPLSLLVIAISIFSLGYESKMGSEQIMGATTKIKLTDPNSVTPAATSTPTANMIPIASSTGYLESWASPSSIFSGFKSEVDVVIVSSTLGDGSSPQYATINCPSGYIVVGGGFEDLNGYPCNYHNYPASSTAWTYGYRETCGTGTESLKGYAICVNIGS